MAWIKDKRNATWVSIAGLAIAGLYVLGLYTAYVVADRLNPRGQPIKLESVAFVDRAVTVGEPAKIRLHFEKFRQCAASLQMVFINKDNEERQFLIEDWPYQGIGHHDVTTFLMIPETLDPGPFKMQIRGYWDCQEEDYTDSSPMIDVELLRKTESAPEPAK